MHWMADDRAAAEWQADEIRTLEPRFNVTTWLSTYPMTDAAQKRRLVKALTGIGPYRQNRDMLATHEVTNQSTPFVDRNLYGVDAALQEGVQRLGTAGSEGELQALGARLGSAEVADWARLANEYPPQLRTFDRSGRRID
jgi:hypothetical protein